MPYCQPQRDDTHSLAFCALRGIIKDFLKGGWIPHSSHN
uniref:Uncharacterized protein n=1 Tax=Anguilla anguilla TaxID=7936 RepID=A0A0E9PG76_ANGAN